jgi:hypothetical protein
MARKLFFTEFGCPGFASPTSSNVIRGMTLDYQRQIDCFQAYFIQMKQLEQGIDPNTGSALGYTPTFGPAIIATAIDGESAVSGNDYGLGLLTASRVRKPVWDYVKGFADESVTVASGY